MKEGGESEGEGAGRKEVRRERGREGAADVRKSKKRTWKKYRLKEIENESKVKEIILCWKKKE